LSKGFFESASSVAKLPAAGIVNQSIEDAIGFGGISNDLLPLSHPPAQTATQIAQRADHSRRFDRIFGLLFWLSIAARLV
jgi:hypothetical protein